MVLWVGVVGLGEGKEGGSSGSGRNGDRAKESDEWWGSVGE